LRRLRQLQRIVGRPHLSFLDHFAIPDELSFKVAGDGDVTRKCLKDVVSRALRTLLVIPVKDDRCSRGSLILG
jgi:hypothetical protein